MIHPGRCLVIAPHPDDETIGCGGLLSRLSRESGDPTGVLAVTMPRIERVEELAKACALLGVTRTWSLDVGTRLRSYDDREVDELDAVVRDFEPDTVLIPYLGAAHQEHRLTHQLAMSVCRPSAGSGRWRPRTVLAYESPADAWSQGAPFRPTWYVSLAPEDIDRKCAALAAHASQVRLWPSERSEEAIRSLATLRGAQNGSDLAEAFEVLRHSC